MNFVRFIALSIWLAACSSSRATTLDSSDAASTLDTTPAGAPDAAVQPLPGCEEFISCCTAPGVSGDGVYDDECGSEGLPCQDCSSLGQRCRTAGDGTYFCTAVLPDGAPCSEGWQCQGATCGAGGTCETTCVALDSFCDPTLGRTTCCDAAAQCTNTDDIGANQMCCYPDGTIVTSTDDCIHCCGSLTQCNFIGPNQFRCGPG